MPRSSLCRLLLALGLATSPRAEDGPQQFLENGVTAHRGNSSEHPENTMPALASGLESGADWVELDIFRTKDGQLVVTHDETTGRVGDRDLVVVESTYDQLKTVDVATEFRRREGLTLAQLPPLATPRLEDVLRLAMAQRRARVSIQPKMDCVREAVALVKALGAEAWVGFNDGDLGYMSEVKRLAPGIPVFWDRPAGWDVDADLRIARERGFEALVVNHAGLTTGKVARIHAAGLSAGAWTVQEADLMRKLLGMGVDRIYTGRPRLLLDVKKSLSP
ncbi:glycerophosphodiester phosphodiesterase [Paludisphaera mucosa]|uniref:Glycerophosphodiester phosphodiesterase n=1 Tax=Paludisphaera mucosa TaxID=3030827 RepID=A0ABT6FJ46_9BACT|nr:glycerophosphodiester phosphodiesterase [Paludisphaera mucosa]MDG3007420.1 glycerophosphodiester phosphodiesterase [Paludisphaera mucosa]